jgi:hypothetical protein
MMGRFYLLCLSLTPRNLSDFTSNACHWPLGTYQLYLPHG